MKGSAHVLQHNPSHLTSRADLKHINKNTHIAFLFARGT